ncbi:MAG: hypothetical protein ACRETU_05920 [Steroidobacterales bacterium]
MSAALAVLARTAVADDIRAVFCASMNIAATMLPTGVRILEIGEFSLFKRNLPGQTTLVFTGDNPDRLAGSITAGSAPRCCRACCGRCAVVLSHYSLPRILRSTLRQIKYARSDGLVSGSRANIPRK